VEPVGLGGPEGVFPFQGFFVAEEVKYP